MLRETACSVSGARRSGRPWRICMVSVRGFVCVMSALVCCLAVRAYGLGEPHYVTTKPGDGGFALVQGGRAVDLYVGAEDWPGVVRAVGDLSDDVKRVTD